MDRGCGRCLPAVAVLPRRPADASPSVAPGVSLWLAESAASRFSSRQPRHLAGLTCGGSAIRGPPLPQASYAKSCGRTAPGARWVGGRSSSWPLRTTARRIEPYAPVGRSPAAKPAAGLNCGRSARGQPAQARRGRLDGRSRSVTSRAEHRKPVTGVPLPTPCDSAGCRGDLAALHRADWMSSLGLSRGLGGARSAGPKEGAPAAG